MGKKRAGVRGSPTQALAVVEEPASPLAARLKEEASKYFGRKDYAKALEAYEAALKATGEESTPEDRALLHSNKAACYLMQQKFKEAVNECSSALTLNPNYHRALVRRAKANEQLGLYKKALQDIQKANKTDTANPDTQETEKRLKDIVHGNKKSVGGGNGLARKQLQMRNGSKTVIMAKCTLGSETRLVPLMGQLTYAEVLDAVTEKFPNQPPFLLKYKDSAGDLVTLTIQQDVHKAVSELIESAERRHGGAHSPRLPQGQLPPLLLSLQPVASPDEVPQPPADELAALAELHAARKVYMAQTNLEARKRVQVAEAAAKEAGQQQQELAPPELEPWLMDFAGLFQDHLGVNSEAHLNLTQHGWDNLQAAVDAAVRDEKSLPLFQKAFDKFQEVSASGQIQMGNVKLALARRLVDIAVTKDEEPSTVAEASGVELDAAEACYKQAQALKGDLYDPLISLANLEFERGKLAMNLAIASLRPVTQEEKDADPKAEETNNNNHAAHLKAGLAKLTPENLEAAAQYYARTWTLLQEALDVVPKELHGVKLKPPPPENQQPAPGEEDLNPWAHCIVVWGNLLYEYSQFLASVDQDWRPQLDSAVEKFRAAGCPETDIRGALIAHSMKESLDLGPDPAEKPAVQAIEEVKPEAEAPEEKELPAVKGLPDLGKPRKKAEKAAAPPSTPEQSSEKPEAPAAAKEVAAAET